MAEVSLQSFVYVGLGNPGRQYEMTRHNMGYLVVQAWGQLLGWSFKEDRRFQALVAKGMIGMTTVHLVLPLTFMNLSGTSVRRYLDYFKVPLQRLVIVTDDIALAFGQLRVREFGSAGGHNGLKSVEAHLGTSRYIRLRMGVGHPGEKLLANYVLEPFSSSEQEELPKVIDRAVEVLQRLLKEPVSQVMNAVNKISESSKNPIDLTKPPA